MDYQSGHVMTLANSIIGVSVLAMPYCFKQCGIVLAILMLLTSSIISRLACHYLLKSAIIARRKTFEYLAYYIFGSLGKFAIEIGIAGFLIGTCIAFFVVMGDLTPEIISEMTGHHTTSTMRSSLLMAMALFCVLPLGLLRNIDALSGVSKVTIGFYFCLVVKIIIEAIPHLFSGDWYGDVTFWRPAGIIQCLPIFAMSLSCQTQLFEIYKVMHNPSLEKMNNLVRIAVNICTVVYILVGVFGYIAFAKKPFTGNILTSLEISPTAYIIKIGFVLSLVFSFPLVIFPSRVSLHSLLYKEGYAIHESTSTYIPESKFKGLTMFIVFISLIIGIMIPNIELVLGLVGSTIGVLICVVFPVASFIYVSPKNTNERLLAQFLLMIGILIMVLGTYENLRGFEKIDSISVEIISSKQNLLHPKIEEDIKNIHVENLKVLEELKNDEAKVIHDSKIGTERTSYKITEDFDVRHEPPQPIEPQEPVDNKKKVPPPENKAKPLEVATNKIVEVTKQKDLEKQNKNVEIEKPVVLEDKEEKSPNNTAGMKIGEEVDIEAIKKDEREAAEAEKENANRQDQKEKRESVHQEDDHKYLIETIQKQSEVQKEIVEQNKKLIEVIKQQQEQNKKPEVDIVKEQQLKAVKEIESIALKAIEEISAGKDSKKVVADLQNNIAEKKNLEEKMADKENTNKKESVKKEFSNKFVASNNNTDQKAAPKIKFISRTSNNVSVLHNGETAVKEQIVRNNTAPYLLNLSKNKTITVLKNNSRLVPLPIAVNMLKKTGVLDTKVNKSEVEVANTKNKKNVTDKETKQEKSPIQINVPDTEKNAKNNAKRPEDLLINANESKALRDILSHVTTRR